MQLARLELVDFRNHPAVGVDLQPGVNLFVGRNGVGKTNLLEAIAFLASLSSYRASQDAALVRSGRASAIIRASALRSGRRLLVELELRPGTGLRGRVNRSPVPRARDLLGAVRAVIFAPEDLALVRGDPEERRRFLDGLAVQRLPRYHAVRQDFDRILRQRNTLLRSAGGRLPSAGLGTLEVWDERLAATGGEVWAERLRLLAALEPCAVEAYRTVAHDSQAVGLRYQSSLGDDVPHEPDAKLLAKVLQARLRQDRGRELERGLTLTGPHRDEVVLRLDELPARTHASHGEAWSLALALRLGAHTLLASDGEEPVLLLDDVFAELDRDRRRRVAEIAAGAEQAIVTAAVAEEVPAELHAATFEVSPGEVHALGSAKGRTSPKGEVSRETGS